MADLLIIALPLSYPGPFRGQESNLRHMIPSEVTVTCTPGAMKFFGPRDQTVPGWVVLAKEKYQSGGTPGAPRQRSTGAHRRAPGLCNTAHRWADTPVNRPNDGSWQS